MNDQVEETGVPHLGAEIVPVFSTHSQSSRFAEAWHSLQSERDDLRNLGGEDLGGAAESGSVEVEAFDFLDDVVGDKDWGALRVAPCGPWIRCVQLWSVSVPEKLPGMAELLSNALSTGLMTSQLLRSSTFYAGADVEEKEWWCRRLAWWHAALAEVQKDSRWLDVSGVPRKSFITVPWDRTESLEAHDFVIVTQRLLPIEGSVAFVGCNCERVHLIADCEHDLRSGGSVEHAVSETGDCVNSLAVRGQLGVQLVVRAGATCGASGVHVGSLRAAIEPPLRVAPRAKTVAGTLCISTFGAWIGSGIGSDDPLAASATWWRGVAMSVEGAGVNVFGAVEETPGLPGWAGTEPHAQPGQLGFLHRGGNGPHAQSSSVGLLVLSLVLS